MIQLRTLLASLCALALLPAPAWSQATASLADVASEAVAHSPALKAMDQAIIAAKARATAAGAPANPSLIGQLQLSPQAANNMLTLGLRQPLDFRGLAAQRKEQVAEDVEILALSRDRLSKQVALQAKEAYYRLWGAREALKVHDRDLTWQQEELSRVNAQIAAGALAPHERVDAEFELMKLERERRSAAQQVLGLEAHLAFLLGRAPGSPVAPLSLDQKEIAPLAPLETWLAEARAQRLEPKEIAVARRREQRGVRLADSMRFGNGEVQAQLGTAANTEPLVYGAFDLPLPVRYDQAGERAGAEAEASRLEAERLVKDQEIAQEVLAAYYASLEAQARLKDIDARGLPFAEHQLEKATARRKAGIGSLTELAAARHGLSDVASERLQALLSYQLSYLRLESAAGR
ncbi:MAG TPA: TolC family protein [Pantanalinema sp.]